MGLDPRGLTGIGESQTLLPTMTPRNRTMNMTARLPAFLITLLLATSAQSAFDASLFEGLEARVTALCFDNKGSKLVSGGHDGELRIWKVSSGKSPEVLSGHAAPIRAIAYGPKGRWAASGDEDGVVKLWDMKKVTEVATLAGRGRIADLAFLDKGKTLAWADGAPHLTLVDLSEL